MNYYLEISKKVEEFCNTVPSPDKRDNYLESADKIKKLKAEAISLECEGLDSNDKRVVNIYNEILKIVG